MFITYDKNGKVVAYSDKERNKFDLSKGEKQSEVDMEFGHVECEEGALHFKDGILYNKSAVMATEILKKQESSAHTDLGDTTDNINNSTTTDVDNIGNN